jgi:hypothetical protein
MQVIDNTAAILGGSDVTGESAEALTPDSPLLRIEGVCVLGGMSVERKSRAAPNELRRGKGVNVSLEAGGPLPIARIKPTDRDD